MLQLTDMGFGEDYDALREVTINAAWQIHEDNAKGSLTAVANAEGVAPAVIGRRIDALERRLGVKLLVRTTRRLSLTHEGSAFLEDCQRLLADWASAEASVSAGGVKASFDPAALFNPGRMYAGV